MSRRLVVKRILFAMLIGLALGLVISEVPFIFLQETARAPQEISLIIPNGTAEQVARGEQPPTLPENMSFVVGDTLIIRNEDSVDHKLGQLWIPANSSAQLSLDQEQSFVYECTFQPGNYFGLDVHEPLTLGTRIYGVLYVGIPLGVLIALYSLVMPVKKKENVPV
ncbi:MAG TPA: hypothetical protein VJ785_19300 [Anaerolineales bacterium]|nr:hypothetical protein [Anaerolineales bacterium]